MSLYPNQHIVMMCFEIIYHFFIIIIYSIYINIYHYSKRNIVSIVHFFFIFMPNFTYTRTLILMLNDKTNKTKLPLLLVF